VALLALAAAFFFSASGPRSVTRNIDELSSDNPCANRPSPQTCSEHDFPRARNTPNSSNNPPELPKDGATKCGPATNTPPNIPVEKPPAKWPYNDSETPAPYGWTLRLPAMPAMEASDFEGLQSAVSYKEGIKASPDESKIRERGDVLLLRVNVQDILSSETLPHAWVEVRSIAYRTVWRATAPYNGGRVRFVLPYDASDTYVVRAKAGDACGLSILSPQSFCILGTTCCTRVQIGDTTGLATADMHVRVSSDAQVIAHGHDVVVTPIGVEHIHGVVMYRESVLGQTNSTGQCRVIFPPADSGSPPPSAHRNRVAFHAPGFLPRFVDLDDPLGAPASPLLIELSARELAVSVNARLDKPSDLNFSNWHLAWRGWDLIPVPGVTQLDYAFALDTPYTPSIRRPLLSGEGMGHPTLDTASGLAKVLGENPKATWPCDYGGWYFHQWRYDEAAGRFDIVLPHPGHFGLVVACGEYRRWKGELVRFHDPYIVLHIDATDPANVTGKLHYAPVVEEGK